MAKEKTQYTLEEVFSGKFGEWGLFEPRYTVAFYTAGVVTVHPFIDAQEARDLFDSIKAKGYPVTICNLDSYLTHST